MSTGPVNITPSNVQCYELVGSRKTTGNDTEMSLESLWIVIGTDDETVARQTVANTTPPIYQDTITNHTLIRKDYVIEDVGYKTWSASVNYSLANRNDPNPPDPPDFPIFSFDTTGGTTHITQAMYGTTCYPASGNTNPPPDLKGAIGVTREGVEGVDITIPTFKFSEQHVWPYNVIDLNWCATIASMTGSVNVNPWRTFAANQVLFLGASGNSQPDGLVTVTYHFDVGINSTTLNVAGRSNVAKNAHDYLWCSYQDEIDNVANRRFLKPTYVWVSQVYPTNDFSQLAIG
jgi:hypothetical protein